MTHARFNEIIWEHYKKNGRHDLPWRKTRDPYSILVSEIMLQQTQVSRVKPFYKNFIKKFPNFKQLSRARTGDVLRAWQGLGYNRRALALKGLSKIVLEKFNGRLPQTREELEALPGIGKATAGAVLAFAFNRPVNFIETNIRRVLIHFFFPRRRKVTDAEIERCIKRTIDEKNPREWYWGLMDYGSSVRLGRNPNRKSAHYTKQSRFSGSARQLRGRILRLLLMPSKNSMKNKRITVLALARELKEPKKRIQKIVTALHGEGFLGRKGKFYCINY